MKYIQEVSRQLGQKPYTLRRWEEYGWLGLDPVMKDPGNNNSRLYSDVQLERIYFIDHKIKEQKKKGIPRTDKQQMDKWLLDNFGGEVVEVESREIELTQVLPSSIESLIEAFANQNKKINDLEVMMRKQAERPVAELPIPNDYTKDFEEMKSLLGASHERDGELLKVVEEIPLPKDYTEHFEEMKRQNEDLRKQNEELKEEIVRGKEREEKLFGLVQKLQNTVDEISKRMKEDGEKGFLKKLLGR